MLGSIAFMASAIGAFVIPRTGSAVDLTLADRGTLVGAVCFFLGALLAIPAWRQAGEAAALDGRRRGGRAHLRRRGRLTAGLSQASCFFSSASAFLSSRAVCLSASLTAFFSALAS